jgi:chemotaxis protein MotB
VPVEDFDDKYEDEEFDGFDEEESTPQPVSEGNWLISYADLMTLVACFFIMLVSFANFEDSGFQGKTVKFAQYFRGSVKKSKGDVEKMPVKGISEEVESIRKVDTEKEPEKQKNLSTYINKVVMRAGISEISKPKDVKVVFSGSAMFGPGKVSLTQDVSDALDIMIDLIKNRDDNFMIIFEGHTDNTDIHNKIYPSNWELSAARASAVLKKFAAAGIPSSKMVAVGYGDSRPIYESVDKNGRVIKENLLLNRRVEIKVLHKKDANDTDLDLGIFFRSKEGKKIPVKTD